VHINMELPTERSDVDDPTDRNGTGQTLSIFMLFSLVLLPWHLFHVLP
jgi:hypothetical protein